MQNSLAYITKGDLEDWGEILFKRSLSVSGITMFALR